jgi:chromosome segregation ATPase
MANTVKELEILKQNVEDLKDQLSRAKGILTQLKKQTKAANHPIEMREQLVQLETERVELQEQYNEAVTLFRETYHEVHGNWP